MASFFRDGSVGAGRVVLQPLTWPGGHEMGATETDTLSPHGISVFVHTTVKLHLPLTSYRHLQGVFQLL